MMPNYNMSKIYWFSNNDENRKGYWRYECGVVSFVCPFCAAENLTMKPDYDFKDTGELTPIFVCTTTKCKFTAHIGFKYYKKIVLEGGEPTA